MTDRYLTTGPIADTVLMQHLASIDQPQQVGAQALFVGRVRADQFDGQPVYAIEYSAYEPMVEEAFAAIRTEFLARFDDLRSLKMLHALGQVAVGEVALMVIIEAGHRVQAFEALPLVVQAIKERVPIWKKELLHNGTHVWTENIL